MNPTKISPEYHTTQLRPQICSRTKQMSAYDNGTKYGQSLESPSEHSLALVLEQRHEALQYGTVIVPEGCAVPIK